MRLAVAVPVLLLASGHLPGSECDYGGHDLFTSLAQLRTLWQGEREAVGDMLRALDNMRRMQDVLERYVSDYRLLELDREPNFEYLGHPVNSYLLVRHVALGWQEIRETVFKTENETRGIFDRLRDREESSRLPDGFDVEGAAFGLARLHSMYDVDTGALVERGVIERSGSDDRVRSEPSVSKLGAWDLRLMAVQSRVNKLYSSMADFLTASLPKVEEEEKAAGEEEEAAMELFLQERPNRTSLEADLRWATKLHDELLIRRGPRGSEHKCHRRPLDPKLRKKKRFKKAGEFVLSEPLRTEVAAAAFRQKDDPAVKEKGAIQYQMLCAGESIRDPSEDADLGCLYAGGADSAWLRLAPLKLEVRSREPYVAVIRELMFAHECDNITAFLEPLLGVPPGRMRGKAPKNDWTMKNAWPVESDNLYLSKMTTRVSHVANLHASSQLNQSERFMCGNYGIGGHYGIHPDYYDYDPLAFVDPSRSNNGLFNRVSTVMTVLEAPEAGGATVWPFAGVTVFPEKGSAAFWFNTKSDAQVDHLSLHAACPVLLGQKWIGNKWIGYSAQHDRRPCGLRPHSRLTGPVPERGRTRERPPS